MPIEIVGSAWIERTWQIFVNQMQVTSFWDNVEFHDLSMGADLSDGLIEKVLILMDHLEEIIHPPLQTRKCSMTRCENEIATHQRRS